MKAAIVTGGSSGIGKEISKRLSGLGIKVYAMGRDFSSFDNDEKSDDFFSVSLPQDTSLGEILAESSIKKETIFSEWPMAPEETAEKMNSEKTDSEKMNSEKFDSEKIDSEKMAIEKVYCDFLRKSEPERTVKNILSAIRERKESLVLLVNSAGTAYYSRSEEIGISEINEMITVNLQAPIIMMRLLLRELLKNKGMIINISSVTALSESPHAACYGACKAGILSFSRSLFQENRRFGLRVVTILPDLTDTDLYRNADFTVSDKEDERLLPEEIAEIAERIFLEREGMVVTEVTVRPVKNRIVKKQKKNQSQDQR